MTLLDRKNRYEHEKVLRRNEILQAAIIVFSQNGFVKTTMEHVAEESSLAVGTLYRYYKSKEELFVAIVFDAMEIMAKKLEEIASMQSSSRSKILIVWDMFLELYEKTPMYYHALLFLHDQSFAGAFSEPAQKAVSVYSGKNFSLLTAIVKEGMDEGSIHKGLPRDVADYLWGTFVGLVNLTESRKNLNIDNSDFKKLHQTMLPRIMGIV